MLTETASKGFADPPVGRFVQADDWILYSTTHQAELARVRCGGWRRQYTHIVSSPSAFTFACYQNRHIHIDRRRDQRDVTQPGRQPKTPADGPLMLN